MKTWRLVSGIVSIVFSSFVLFQSCAAGISNSMSSNGQVSGTAGVIVALMMMSGGILSIATRKEIQKGDSVALAVIYGIGVLIGVALAGDFEDLIIWALWCFVCAVLAIGAYALTHIDEMPDDEQPDQVPGEDATRRGRGKKKHPLLNAIKWVLIVLGGGFVLLVVIALLSGSPSEEEKGIPDLTGTWKQVNSSSSDGYQAAVITDNVIEVYWVDKTTETESLYWAGSFKAPTTTDEPYSWVSTNDKSRTDYALLASGDSTKTFTYQDGQISYRVSLLGTTKTVKLEKAG